MITLAEIQGAREHQQGRVLNTPLFPLAERLPGTEGIWLKAENLQHTGSFKIRGATHCIALLSDQERQRGVVAASAGNHAQGVAQAASLQDVHATIVMPHDAPLIKVERTRRTGAEIVLVEGGIEEAMERAHQIARERSLTFIHPFDDPRVQAGQGTAGLEILEALPAVDSIVVPVGGGGLIAGISVAVRQQRSQVRVFGVQAGGAAPAARSLKAGRPVTLEKATTMADGIRVRAVADSTFAVMRRYVEAIVTVSDEEISQGMVYLMETTKLVVEGAGAAGMAALLAGRLPTGLGRTVVVLSGGNADTNLIARVIERGLISAGRYVLVVVNIPDRPGYLRDILNIVATQPANILDIRHDRSSWRVHLGDVQVQLLLETRQAAHGEEICAALRARGMDASLEPAPSSLKDEKPAT